MPIHISYLGAGSISGFCSRVSNPLMCDSLGSPDSLQSRGHLPCALLSFMDSRRVLDFLVSSAIDLLEQRYDLQNHRIQHWIVGTTQTSSYNSAGKL